MEQITGSGSSGTVERAEKLRNFRSFDELAEKLAKVDFRIFFHMRSRVEGCWCEGSWLSFSDLLGTEASKEGVELLMRDVTERVDAETSEGVGGGATTDASSAKASVCSDDPTSEGHVGDQEEIERKKNRCTVLSQLLVAVSQQTRQCLGDDDGMTSGRSGEDDFIDESDAAHDAPDAGIPPLTPPVPVVVRALLHTARCFLVFLHGWARRKWKIEIFEPVKDQVDEEEEDDDRAEFRDLVARVGLGVKSVDWQGQNGRTGSGTQTWSSSWHDRGSSWQETETPGRSWKEEQAHNSKTDKKSSEPAESSEPAAASASGVEQISGSATPSDAAPVSSSPAASQGAAENERPAGAASEGAVVEGAQSRQHLPMQHQEGTSSPTVRSSPTQEQDDWWTGEQSGESPPRAAPRLFSPAMVLDLFRYPLSRQLAEKAGANAAPPTPGERRAIVVAALAGVLAPMDAGERFFVNQILDKLLDASEELRLIGEGGSTGQHPKDEEQEGVRAHRNHKTAAALLMKLKKGHPLRDWRQYDCLYEHEFLQRIEDAARGKFEGSGVGDCGKFPMLRFPALGCYRALLERRDLSGRSSCDEGAGSSILAEKLLIRLATAALRAFARHDLDQNSARSALLGIKEIRDEIAELRLRRKIRSFIAVEAIVAPPSSGDSWTEVRYHRDRDDVDPETLLRRVVRRLSRRDDQRTDSRKDQSFLEGFRCKERSTVENEIGAGGSGLFRLWNKDPVPELVLPAAEGENKNDLVVKGAKKSSSSRAQGAVWSDIFYCTFHHTHFSSSLSFEQSAV